MKKIALLLFLGVFFTSCNDGDFVFDELKFPGNVQKCNNKGVFYKLNGNEMLILNMSDEIKEDTTIPLNQERTIDANGKIIYRQYSEKAISASLCDLIAPAFPQVIEEFKVAPGGKIKYNRFRRITQKENDNKVGIEYIYTFNFTNIVLENGSKELKFENYNYGEFIDSNISLLFNFTNSFVFCDNSTTNLVAFNEKQGLKIVSDNLQFENVVGSKNIALNTTNYIEHLFFSGSSILTKLKICDILNPDSNLTLTENWKATQGVLEIVTTANSTTENPNVIIGYKHTLTLKNAKFVNGSDSFTITEQKLGEYIPPVNN